MNQPRWFLPRYGPYGQNWRLRNLYPSIVKGIGYLGAGVGATKAIQWGKSSAGSKSSSYKSANMGGNYGYASRVYRQKPRNRRRKYAKKGKFNKNQKKYIKKIAESAVDDNNINTWRDLDSGQISCEVNQCAYSSITLLSQTEINNAIDGSRALDPNGGVLNEVVVDLSSVDGVKTKIINAKKIITFRNNSRAPANLKCYWVSYKKRGATSLQGLFEDGLENSGITSNEQTDLRFDVYDSQTFRDFCKVFKTRKYRLNGGDEVELVLERKRPVYHDPDEFDQHSASEYVPRITLGLLFRLEGVVSHDDTTTTNVGTCDTTLDYVVKSHIKFSGIGGSLKVKNLIVGSGALDAQAIDAKVVVDSIDEVTETL